MPPERHAPQGYWGASRNQPAHGVEMRHVAPPSVIAPRLASSRRTGATNCFFMHPPVGLFDGLCEYAARAARPQASGHVRHVVAPRSQHVMAFESMPPGHTANSPGAALLEPDPPHQLRIPRVRPERCSPGRDGDRSVRLNAPGTLARAMRTPGRSLPAPRNPSRGFPTGRSAAWPSLPDGQDLLCFVPSPQRAPAPAMNAS